MTNASKDEEVVTAWKAGWHTYADEARVDRSTAQAKRTIWIRTWRTQTQMKLIVSTQGEKAARAISIWRQTALEYLESRRSNIEQDPFDRRDRAIAKVVGRWQGWPAWREYIKPKWLHAWQKYTDEKGAEAQRKRRPREGERIQTALLAWENGVATYVKGPLPRERLIGDWQGAWRDHWTDIAEGINEVETRHEEFREGWKEYPAASLVELETRIHRTQRTLMESWRTQLRDWKNHYPDFPERTGSHPELDQNDLSLIGLWKASEGDSNRLCRARRAERYVAEWFHEQGFAVEDLSIQQQTRNTSQAWRKADLHVSKGGGEQNFYIDVKNVTGFRHSVTRRSFVKNFKTGPDGQAVKYVATRTTSESTKNFDQPDASISIEGVVETRDVQEDIEIMKCFSEKLGFRCVVPTEALNPHRLPLPERCINLLRKGSPAP